MAAQTLSSTSESRWNHDVFLSFRGEDTRKAFTDHLYTALVHAGIHTFRDDEELPRGNHISTELLKAIQGSRVSIVVFSKGYASSCWCLDELVEIMRCKNFIGQTLIPIFYNVDPSDVRKQTGTFAEAFSRHEQRFQAEIDRVHKWRAALTEAADYSGWHLQNISNGYESKFIEKIVEEILCKVSQACLHVAIHPIGIHSRVEKMKALLNLGTSDVRIVGMYGMGGIGKTTIAKAVHNDICHEFEGSSFLLNIKEISEQPNGLIRLQEQLLSDILKTKKWKISNLDVGINLIMKRFCRKRVLVVLDDVDNMKQLHSFLGNFEFFGPGSRVIATTRDEHVLTKLGVHEKYKVEEMNLEESLQLFSWHAFKKAHPREDYLKLSLGVVAYVGGLPLAVEVLGSYLLGRSIIQWESALEKLQKIPHKEIQKILKISFDSLEDDYLRDIFLDIACFFIGTNKEYASKVFDGCDFNLDIGITILIERSLLTINEINELRMHDLIRDMGREIVREMSPKDPGQRSRLWFRKDVLDVLNNHLGSEAIEGLILNLPVLEDVRIKIEAFAKMKKLRLLQIDGRYLTGCYEHLSKELRWLHWHKCPLKFLPPNFSLENLVILDMQYTNVKQVWKEIKILNKLKVLNLRGSKCLTQSPNFLRVPHLEILILEDCKSLVEVHDSIGHLKNLVLLNLRGCKNLKNLPEIISNLESLETLNLSHCIKIDKLPKQLGNMVALRELLADGTAIKQLPYSFGLLKKLKFVSLSGCKRQSSKSLMSGFLSWLSQKCTKPINLLPTSVDGLCSLRELNLSGCNLFEDEIPNDLGSLPSLEQLWLGRNNFRSLPPCIGRLPKLYVLLLHECTSLKSISELPASLLYLDTHDCSSLQRLPNLVPNQERLDTWFCMESCVDSLAFDFRKMFLQCVSKCGGRPPYIVLPGCEVPNWFSHKRIGSSISFHIPLELPKGQIMGLLVCAVYARREDTKFSRRSALAEDTLSININNRPFEMFNRYTRARHYGESYLVYFPNSFFKAEIENGNEITIDWKIEREAEVKKCGVHLIVDEPNALGEYVDSDTCGDCMMDLVSAKRGRNDNEAGPSNDCSSHENCPKRSRIKDSEA